MDLVWIPGSASACRAFQGSAMALSSIFCILLYFLWRTLFERMQLVDFHFSSIKPAQNVGFLVHLSIFFSLCHPKYQTHHHQKCIIKFIFTSMRWAPMWYRQEPVSSFSQFSSLLVFWCWSLLVSWGAKSPLPHHRSSPFALVWFGCFPNLTSLITPVDSLHLVHLK